MSSRASCARQVSTRRRAGRSRLLARTRIIAAAAPGGPARKVIAHRRPLIGPDEGVETDRQRGQRVEVVDLQLVHLQVGQNHRLRSRRGRGRVDLLAPESPSRGSPWSVPCFPCFPCAPCSPCPPCSPCSPCCPCWTCRECPCRPCCLYWSSRCSPCSLWFLCSPWWSFQCSPCSPCCPCWSCRECPVLLGFLGCLGALLGGLLVAGVLALHGATLLRRGRRGDHVDVEIDLHLGQR